MKGCLEAEKWTSACPALTIGLAVSVMAASSVHQRACRRGTREHHAAAVIRVVDGRTPDTRLFLRKKNSIDLIRRDEMKRKMSGVHIFSVVLSAPIGRSVIASDLAAVRALATRLQRAELLRDRHVCGAAARRGRAGGARRRAAADHHRVCPFSAVSHIAAQRRTTRAPEEARATSGSERTLLRHSVRLRREPEIAPFQGTRRATASMRGRGASTR